MLSKKEGKVDRLIKEHIKEVKEGVQALREAVFAYLDGDRERFKQMAELTDSQESKADEVRREAEDALAGAYLPVYREDFSILLELIDNMADDAERAADFLTLETPKIPPQWGKGLKEIVEKTWEAYLAFEQSFLLLYEDVDRVAYVVLRSQGRLTDKPRAVWWLTI